MGHNPVTPYFTAGMHTCVWVRTHARLRLPAQLVHREAPQLQHQSGYDPLRRALVFPHGYRVMHKVQMRAMHVHSSACCRGLP